MGGDDISSTKHRLSYAANGPRDHSSFKGKILATGGVTIDIILGKKSFNDSHIHSVCHGVTF